MKINLLVNASPEATDALVDGGLFSRDEAEPPLLLDAAGDTFSSLLELTNETSGSWLNPILEFSLREAKAARYFLVRARKTVSETDGDFRLNGAHVDDCPWIETGSEDGGVRLPTRLTVSGLAKLKPNTVAVIDQWTEEFVVGSAVAAAWREAGFSGYSLNPVLDGRSGKPWEEFRHLYSDTFMPPVVPDKTMPRSADDRPGRRQLGCLVFPSGFGGRDLSDINRTAEPWRSHGFPAFVVSARVRNHFATAGLRGWTFQPVLEQGSPLHSEYLAQWDRLFELTSENPKNFF